MHHSPFFWVAFVCILIAMVVFIVSGSLALAPTAGTAPAAVAK